MSTLDIIILIPLVIGAWKGFKDGLIVELFSFLALIFAIIGGFKLLHVVMGFLRDTWDINGEWLPVLAFLLIFIGIIILTNIAGKAISKIINVTFLGVFDKIGGAVLAVFKWALGVSILLWILDRMSLEVPNEWIGDSVIYPYLEPLADYMWGLVAWIFPMASEFFDELKEFTLE